MRLNFNFRCFNWVSRWLIWYPTWLLWLPLWFFLCIYGGVKTLGWRLVLATSPPTYLCALYSIAFMWRCGLTSTPRASWSHPNVPKLNFYFFFSTSCFLYGVCFNAPYINTGPCFRLVRTLIWIFFNVIVRVLERQWCLSSARWSSECGWHHRSYARCL